MARLGACVLLFLSALQLSAGTEFKYGTIRWEHTGGNTVQFFIEMQWRRGTGATGFQGTGMTGLAIQGNTVDILGNPNSATGPVQLETGDGRSQFVKMTVESYSASSEDFIHGVARVVHSYMTPRSGTQPWTATLKGCCRAGNMKAFQLTTTVDLTRQSLRSPAFRSLPVITVGKMSMGSNMTMGSDLVHVDLPARDSMGNSARYWRMAQGAELGTAMALPTSAVFFSGTDYLSGRLSVNVSQLAEGSHPVVVQASVTGAMVPVDFLLKVVSAEDKSMMPMFVGDIGDSSAGTGMTELMGYVGYEVFFTLTARSPRPGGDIAEGEGGIRAFSKPVGLFFTNWRMVGDATRAADVRWTPAEDQVGTHVMCYQAVDSHANRLSSEQQCVRMVIHPMSGAPRFVSPAPGSTFNMYMRNMSSFTISAESDNPYDTLIIEPTMPLMHGQEMSAMAESMGRVRATDMASRAVVMTEFMWNADTNFGGYSEQICFRLTNPIGNAAPASSSDLCVMVVVPRCKYVAQGADQDVKQIGEIFGLDWLTIWGSNVQLETMYPMRGDEVTVGRLYTVLPGDTLVHIARELETTVTLLRRLNWDLKTERAAKNLEPYSQICIFPNTCAHL